jgi:hypothetical protein
MKIVKIGEVSHGTLLARDLLDTFADELEDLARGYRLFTTFEDEDAQRQKHFDLVREARDTVELLDEDAENGGIILDGMGVEERLSCSEVIEQLTDALGEYAPPYTYFGANEGDGACFGFWPDVEGARDSDDILVVDDLAAVPEGHALPVLVINCHGNATFYEPVITYKPLWDCV